MENGATIINDVSGLDYDSELIDIVLKYNATIVIQHSIGNADNIVNYSDVVEEVYLKLKEKVDFAKSKGVNNIILDIGIGFGKNKEQNLELLSRIEEFYSLKFPIMVGTSRKSFLDVKDCDNNTKDSMTLAINYPLMLKKVDYLRVHNVKLHRQLLNLVN